MAPDSELDDDASTASEPDVERPALPTPTPPEPPTYRRGVKRPRPLGNDHTEDDDDDDDHDDGEIDVKVEWTDESDGVYERLKKRKRRSSGRGGRGRPKIASSANDVLPGTALRADQAEQDKDTDISDYIHERRRAFDARCARLGEAGLLLPPDYAAIDFSDDEGDQRRQRQRRREKKPATATTVFGVAGRLSGDATDNNNADKDNDGLRTRPQFDSSVRPSRARKPVELPYSGGVIPASIAQYLRDYQIAGVQFLHRLFVYQRGGILGDDMGLGKTVQVAAFLAVAFGKTGDERDAKRMRKMRRANDNQWYPQVLVVCPGSVIDNWRCELQRWGWWHVDVFHGAGKDDVLQAARAGRLEVLVTTYATYKNHRERLNGVRWDAVVADECHLLKDPAAETTRAMLAVNALCRIGLTGTAIQNRYEELWTLLHWTNPGRFGALRDWTAAISRPLMLGQAHDATVAQLSRARRTARQLVQNLLPPVFLRRTKALLADQLPKKTDRVVFCPLTPRQAAAYARLVDSEPVRLLRTATDPCDCGSKRKRGWCCYRHLPDGKTTWVSIMFPMMQSLLKLANHLTLLVPTAQGGASTTTVDGEGDEGEATSTTPITSYDRAMQVLKICEPDDWATLWRQRDALVTLGDPAFCGKWTVLRRLLRLWHANGDKVLVFSHNVRLLHILQHLFRHTSYSVSYLDGALGYSERQRVVDAFNADPAQFVFLISTRAGGVGLNIASANKVVVFDPHWNPAYDLQAQDRAYRIGQARDVDVFRLVSAGTIEEIVYARQVYKQQQANIGYRASTERRYFRGVQQEPARRGEIFGLRNLFAFYGDQVVLRDIVHKTNIAEAKAGVHLTAIDMEEAAQAADADGATAVLAKLEGGDAPSLKQLAVLDPDEEVRDEDKEDKEDKEKDAAPSSDAIQAILASAGVEYTHDNAEVVGSSRVEAQLSRQAELFLGSDGDEDDGQDEDDKYDDEPDDDEDPDGRHARLADTFGAFAAAADLADLALPGGNTRVLAALPSAPPHFRLQYNPPADVCRRQFCTMARLASMRPLAFARVVEGWTPEQRRQCLARFYRQRAAVLWERAEQERETASEGEEDVPVGDANEVKVRVKPEEDNVKTKGEDEVKIKLVPDDNHAVLFSPVVKTELVKSELVIGEPVKTEQKNELFDDDETDEL